MQTGRLGAHGRRLKRALWVVLAGSIYVFVITFAFAASAGEKRVAVSAPEASSVVAGQGALFSSGDRTRTQAAGLSSAP